MNHVENQYFKVFIMAYKTFFWETCSENKNSNNSSNSNKTPSSSIANIVSLVNTFKFKIEVQNKRTTLQFEQSYQTIKVLSDDIIEILDGISSNNRTFIKIDSLSSILERIQYVINEVLSEINELYAEHIYGFYNDIRIILLEKEIRLMKIYQNMLNGDIICNSNNIGNNSIENNISHNNNLNSNTNNTTTSNTSNNNTNNTEVIIKQPKKNTQKILDKIDKSSLPSSNNNLLNENMNPRFHTSFYYNEFIQHDEELEIEYKQYAYPLNETLITILKKTICGFLNANGGRIYLGINDNKQVKGIKLEYKDRDLFRNQLVNITRDFFPACRTTIGINVMFIPVKYPKEKKRIVEFEFIKNLYVVKLIINQGDMKKLYSIIKYNYTAYMRMPGQVVQLSAEEIANEIVDRSNYNSKTSRNSKRMEIESSKFDDPEPEKPIYNNEEKNMKIYKPNFKGIENIGKYSSSNSSNKSNYNSNTNEVTISLQDIPNTYKKKIY